MVFSSDNLPKKGVLSSIRLAGGNVSLKLMICAVIAGLLGGYGALAFRFAIGEIQNLFYGFDSELVVSGVAELPWWQIVAAPVIGGLIVGLFLQYCMPGKRGQGVADVIEAVMIKRGKMKLWPGIAAFFVSALSLGAGTSGGREGPVVHLSATMASQLGQRLRLPSSYYLTLIGCGVASGVAASFNAPIAGMFFALEVVIGSLATQAVAPIVLASVIGTVVSRIHVGDFPAFIIPNYNIVSWWELPAIAILGIVSAIVALLFIWSMGFAERTIDRFKIPEILRPASGGLVLGGIAVFFPQIIGVGYEATDNALNENYDLLLLLSLIIIKTIAVGITMGSRFGGGFFSPSLFIGAMTGGAFGIIATSVFPELSASHGLYAIIGMTAVASSVLGAPISTILIVFELTGDYKIGIAVMVAVSVATLITKQIYGRSIFQTQLARRNVDVWESRALRYLKFRQVRGIMDKEFSEIPTSSPLSEVRKIIGQLPHQKLVAVDPTNKAFVGMINFSNLKAHILADEIDRDLTVADITSRDIPVIFPESSLKSALMIMEKSGLECLPVIDSAADARIVGLLHYRKLLSEYNQALLNSQDETSGKMFP
ncbi:chloride channel protein [Sneathiella chinensis]|uniref:Chloride channel protein n=1 Tax=Sneathiella chinensis TaxID=349750 RepID=A0ABQ5U3P2_9PROT|nr:chloride channel protein [Sneathiella chinensis]GLQ06021.1 chloride channel protein [Sneathiella chinensis]